MHIVSACCLFHISTEVLSSMCSLMRLCFCVLWLCGVMLIEQRCLCPHTHIYAYHLSLFFFIDLPPSWLCLFKECIAKRLFRALDDMRIHWCLHPLSLFVLPLSFLSFSFLSPHPLPYFTAAIFHHFFSSCHYNVFKKNLPALNNVAIKICSARRELLPCRL